MNADYVEKIIRNIDEQSYKCILVDGAWGIGKSYMVKKALEDMKDRTCFISLFGMDDCQKIYHEVLFQFAFRTSRGGKIASSVQNFAKAAGNFCTEVSNVSNALAQAISERELFAMTSEKFKKNRIIVIDDLERRKSGLDLEELFGVIEDLKQLNYIKIILIANSKEICNEDSLYRRESFPVDNMNEQKRSICYNILTTLYLHDKDRLEQCYNELKDLFGKTGRMRTEDIFKEIKETN